MARLFSIALVVFGFSLAGAQEIVEVQNKSYWLCKNRKEVRTIRVHVESSGMCKTHYAKGGDEKLVGSGLNLGSCIGFLDNIKTNLEKASWNCRDITATRITASVEE